MLCLGIRTKGGLPMFSTILVPLDGSDTAAQALPAAREMAKRFGSRIVLVQVLSTAGASLALGANAASGAMTDPSAITGEVAEEVQVAMSYLSAAAEQLAAEGISTGYEVRDGSAADGIIEAATAGPADLIVMCSHGRSGLRRAVFGSVADEVMRKSGTPVLMVRASDAT
jgi:nucleotide-binding universal stress UspA family protein